MTLVINDTTDIQQLMNTHPFGGCKNPDDYTGPPCASAPDDSDLIPWEEVPDRISDMVKNKSSLVDLWRQSPIGKPFQSYTNYCWCWCAVDALMIEREREQQPFVKLSPSSVAAPIMNFSNVGGWPEQALDWLMKKGCAPVTHVPDVTTNPRDFKKDWEKEAAKYKVSGWERVFVREDSRAKNKQRQISKLLHNKPLAAAFMFMSHAMTPLFVSDDKPALPYNDPNRYGLWVLNSHNDGVIKLEGRYAYCDSAYATTKASFAGVV